MAFSPVRTHRRPIRRNRRRCRRSRRPTSPKVRHSSSTPASPGRTFAQQAPIPGAPGRTACGSAEQICGPGERWRRPGIPSGAPPAASDALSARAGGSGERGVRKHAIRSDRPDRPTPPARGFGVACGPPSAPALAPSGAPPMEGREAAVPSEFSEDQGRSRIGPPAEVGIPGAERGDSPTSARTPSAAAEDPFAFPEGRRRRAARQSRRARAESAPVINPQQ